MKMDINSDIGEYIGGVGADKDEKIMAHVTSVNVACGFHAGDYKTMAVTVQSALKHGCKIGAHPSFPDRENFGRSEMDLPLEEVRQMLLYQIGGLKAIVESYGGRLSHVKPHGALYNMAAKDQGLAMVIAKTVAEIDSELHLFGLSGSVMAQAAKANGLTFRHEVFADRAYQKDGSLVPRSVEGAVIHDVNLVNERVVEMVSNGKVRSIEGEWIAIASDTVCVHGDTEEALAMVKQLSVRLGEIE